jgi:hypothetical protein
MATKRDRLRVRAILDETDFDPIRHLIAIARNPSTPLDLQIDACRFMLPFAHPRLAEFEIKVESPDAQPTTVNFVTLLAGEPDARRAIEDALIRASERRRQQIRVEEIEARKLSAPETSEDSSTDG